MLKQFFAAIGILLAAIFGSHSGHPPASSVAQHNSSSVEASPSNIGSDKVAGVQSQTATTSLPLNTLSVFTAATSPSVARGSSPKPAAQSVITAAPSNLVGQVL